MAWIYDTSGEMIQACGALMEQALTVYNAEVGISVAIFAILFIIVGGFCNNTSSKVNKYTEKYTVDDANWDKDFWK